MQDQVLACIFFLANQIIVVCNCTFISTNQTIVVGHCKIMCWPIFISAIQNIVIGHCIFILTNQNIVVCHCIFISANQNIVVGHCKLHNDASCDISQDGRLLATFVPSHQGFPDDNILAVYSLEPGSPGQCLYTKSFGKDLNKGFGPLCNKTCLLGFVNNKGADQPVHPCSLINTFVVRVLESIIFLFCYR